MKEKGHKALSMVTLSRRFINQPALCVAIVGAFTAIAALGLLKLEVRTDGAAIYPEDNLTVERTKADGRRFLEREQIILLATSRPGGPVIESPQGFAHLKELHESLRKLPGLRPEGLRSVADLLAASEKRTSLRVRTYLETIPGDPSEFAGLVKNLRAHPLTDGLFLSRDGRAAAFYIPLSEPGRRQEAVSRLRTWIAERETTPFELRLTGPVIAETHLAEVVLRDLVWLIPLVVLAVVAILYLSLGTIGGVVVTMVEVVVVLTWTLGAMGHLGIPITLVTTIMPVVLLATAVLDEIHLLERVHAYLAARDEPAGGSAGLAEGVLKALQDIQRPLILTSLTTSVAFLSFQTASMAPVRHFGLFTAAGMLLAMILTFTLIPALIVLLPGSWFRRRWAPPSGVLSLPPGRDRLLARHNRWNFAIGLMLLAACIPGLFLLNVQDSWLDNFDPDSALVSAEREFNDRFWGSYRFDVVLDSDREGFFYQTDGLALTEAVIDLAEEGPHVGGVVTHLTAFRILAEAWGESSKISALPPETFDSMAARVNLLKYRIDQFQFVTRDGSSIRIRIFASNSDYQRGLELQEHLARALPLLTEGPGVLFHFSGDLPVAVEVVQAIVLNQLRSIGWTLLGVALILVLALRSLRDALILMSPVLTASCLVFGVMGYLGLSLGIATSMFSALTIGVGVDFALHYWHRYFRERSLGRLHPIAFLITLRSTGRAMRWNAAVLALGFLVLTFSALKPNRSLGLLLAAAVLASYGATLLLLPHLTRLVAAGGAHRRVRARPAGRLEAPSGGTVLDRS